MPHVRPLLVASLLSVAACAHAASDAEIRGWLDELVGSELVLQELAAGHCSEFLRRPQIDLEAWYSWGAALASPGFRANAERSRAEVMATARTRASQWVANEFRNLPGSRPLQRTCTIYSGMFRTIRDAAEWELEDIEYRLRGNVTPRPQR